jgi:hypothetical protein
MIDIVVIRDPGDVSGEDVVSPLISSLEVALSRGRQEIEKHAQAKSVSLKVVWRPGVRKGQIVEVSDPIQGPVWRGVVLGLSHVVDGPEVYSVLDVEQPHEPA